MQIRQLESYLLHYASPHNIFLTQWLSDLQCRFTTTLYIFGASGFFYDKELETVESAKFKGLEGLTSMLPSKIWILWGIQILPKYILQPSWLPKPLQLLSFQTLLWCALSTFWHYVAQFFYKIVYSISVHMAHPGLVLEPWALIPNCNIPIHPQAGLRYFKPTLELLSLIETFQINKYA